MNTGVLVNLIYRLIQSFEIMMGLVKRAPCRPGEGVPEITGHGIAKYLPSGFLVKDEVASQRRKKSNPVRGVEYLTCCARSC